MSRLFLGCLAVLSMGACALRPLYRDLVPKETAGKELKLVLTDRATKKPLPNVRIEHSEFKNRVSVTTAADGTFTLPVDKKYFDENPIVVIGLPTGVEAYDIATYVPPPPQPPPPVVEPAPVEAAPVAPAAPAAL